MESSFGWALQGPVSTSSVSDAACMHISLQEDAQISKQLHAFWEVESLGIVSEKTQNPDETEALQSFNHALTYKDGRYQVELPWRADKPDLPDNFTVAKRRFEGLKKKLRTDATLYTRYNEVIQDYLQQGICEDVPDDSSAAEQPETVRYYMPHHAVLREDKGLLDILKGKENTKRSVLQTSARIFDPIGFLTPFTIRVKCLFKNYGKGVSGGMNSYPQTWLEHGISGVQSYRSSTWLQFQDGTKMKHSQTLPGRPGKWAG
ncbi:hypothetical protein DPEC_G00060970 [Dallia pectoralis]|uniref:Uncharacterized protein n=1 Tax=Dallia pectoralis TaxID=75939 RepID=A0ACC2H7H4_DALPE|nr:hypothetical protein DPEC_G00060970 [Dallia pectoralis]